MAVSMEYESKIVLSVVKCEMLRSTYYINLRFSMHVCYTVFKFNADDDSCMSLCVVFEYQYLHNNSNKK